MRIASVLSAEAALQSAKAWIVGLVALLRRILSEARHVRLVLVGCGGGRRAARLLLVEALVFEGVARLDGLVVVGRSHMMRWRLKARRAKFVLLGAGLVK